MTATHAAALRDLLDAIRHGSLRDEWAAWLIYADWLDEEPAGVVRGEDISGACGPDVATAQADLAAKIRSAIAAEREVTAANGGRRDRSELAVGYQVETQITHVLTGEARRWYVGGETGRRAKA
jgi:uncharacterized protein (TIGR02996 family)